MKIFITYFPSVERSLTQRQLLLCLLIFVTLITPAATWANDLGGSTLRNYPVALPLAEGKLEVSLDYQLLNETVDVLGIREQEYASLSAADRATAPGDLWGLRLLLNYGLFRSTTLMSAFEYRNYDYGYDSIGIKTLDLSLKQSLLNRRHGSIPKLALDAGVRFNAAADMLYNDQNEINAIIQRISPDSNVDIRIDDHFVWFDQTINGDQYSLGAPRQGRPDPQISIGDFQDFSSYVRLTVGQIWGCFFPNFFAEYGHTQINTKADSTLTEYVPDAFKSRLPQLPLDLSRSENYFKTGLNLLIKFPYKALLRLEYNYLKLFREDHLDYMDYNHIYKADLNYYLTPSLVLNIGGTYFQRQLNGEIPFLYNEFTQTTFDHPYSYAHIGLTFFFDNK